MTALTTTPRPEAAAGGAGVGLVPGFGGLLRKELTEWRRGRRTWVVFLVSALFMTLAALNTWLQTVLPEEARESGAAPPVEPMAILANALGSQVFAVAAIFAVMGLLVAERESGTLAWTASKPVSRSAIWLAKLAASVGVLWIAAGLLPLAATVVLVLTLYGGVDPGATTIMALGTGLSVIFYVVVALAASTVVTSQSAVAAIALGAMFMPQLLGLVVPPQFLPTSILAWTIMATMGEPPGLATPLVWAGTIAVLVAFSVRRMEAMEL